MISSRRHRFVFVHIQKTGGDTVRHLLDEHFDELDEIAAKHDPAWKGQEHLKEWNSFFSFAFVRNPWERLVSWYNMIEEASRLKWHHKLIGSQREQSHRYQAENNRLWRYVLENSSTFEEFVKHCTDEVAVYGGGFGAQYSFTYNQLDYLTDAENTIIVDFIGRFERFEEDLRSAFSQLGIDLETLPHKNKSSHRHYSTYYTPETREIVRERYRRDIDHFGYDFERV